MNNDSSVSADLASLLASYAATNGDPVALRGRIREILTDVQAVAPNDTAAAINSLACCLEVVGPDSAASLADVMAAITKFLVDWERLAAGSRSVDAAIPEKVLARAPDSVRRDKRFPMLLGKVEKSLGRALSKMTITAVIKNVDPEAVPRLIKSERNADVLASLLSSHGDFIDARAASLAFKRANKASLSPELTQAFATLKHKTIAALLPLDDQGALGQILSRAVLGAIVNQMASKILAMTLRNSGSRKVIECCLEERLFVSDISSKDAAAWLKALFEGLGRFSRSDADSICGRLVISALPLTAIFSALNGPANRAAWRELGRSTLIRAALHVASVPELRVRAISLLVLASEHAWLDDESFRGFRNALALPSEAADDDHAEPAPDLRWRFCDRIIASLESAAKQNCDRAAVSALIMTTLGEFGLRKSAYPGDRALFDSELHETTLWSCRPGEPVLLKTELLRLDDAVAGPLLRRSEVIPVRKAEEN